MMVGEKVVIERGMRRIRMRCKRERRRRWMVRMMV